MGKNYMDYFKSPEEFIRILATSRSKYFLVDKGSLIKIANKHGISTERNISKAKIYDLILEKISLEEFAELLACGVYSGSFQEKFGITHQEVKRMARLGFIKTVGYERIRLYGKYRNVDLYSVFDYFRLTKEDMHNWLEANPKGTRKKK